MLRAFNETNHFTLALLLCTWLYITDLNTEFHDCHCSVCPYVCQCICNETYACSNSTASVIGT